MDYNFIGIFLLLNSIIFYIVSYYIFIIILFYNTFYLCPIFLFGINIITGDIFGINYTGRIRNKL